MVDEESEALEYIHSTRGKLGGYLPSRKSPEIDFNLPSEETYSQFDNGTP